MHYLIKLCKKFKIRKLLLEVSNDNTNAEKFYNKFNFYTIGIRKKYYKDGSEILIDRGKNKEPRKLTPRECANLQGFPNKFILNKSDIQAYKQFGNSVPIPLVKEICKEMLKVYKI